MTAQQTLEKARALVDALESGDAGTADALLEELGSGREAALFQELGKLTRELHETLNNFRLDSRIAALAEHEIPDAKERLNYVIAMTEQAANRTLEAVEESLPIAERIEAACAAFAEGWGRFRRRELAAEEFRALSHELDAFFSDSLDGARALRANLSDVLMAQDFQDLTGQIIRRVITLVQDVEQSLVNLVRLSGTAAARPEAAAAGRNLEAQGPAVPGVDSPGEIIQGQDDVDDLLSSLGF